MAIEAPIRQRSNEGSTTLSPLIEGLHRANEQFISEGRPMTKKIRDIHEAINNSDTLIIEGQTGSGKTTVASIAILEALLESNPNTRVAMTLPRRDAAKSFVSDLNSLVGNNYIGYRIRGESTVQHHTRLEAMMPRSLMNEIMADPSLRKYNAVIIDEPDVRSGESDILIAELTEIQRRRATTGDPPLKLILLSATLDKEKFKPFLGDPTVIEAEGRMYKVHEHFEEQQVQLKDLPEKSAQQTAEILSSTEEGDILIFLPGRREIRKTREELKKIYANDEYDLIELTGGDKTNSEKIKRNQDNKRAVFLATDVIEVAQTPTSIKYVIDSGFMRKATYDQKLQILKMITRLHTQRNARQRGGRVGRVGEGWVYHLYPKTSLLSRDEHLTPEILEQDLSPLILMLKGLGKNNPEEFPFIDRPPKENIENAIKKLQRLSALDTEGKLTDIGQRMLTIEADDPTFARIIVEAQNLGVSYETAVLTGILQSDKPIYEFNDRDESFLNKFEKYIEGGNDIATLINIWNDYVENIENKDWGKDNGINTKNLESAVRSGMKMLDKNEETKNRKIDLDATIFNNISRALLTGLRDNIVNPSGPGFNKAIGDAPVRITKNSALSGLSGIHFLAGKFSHRESDDTVEALYNFVIPQEIAEAISPPVSHSSESDSGVNPTSGSEGQHLNPEPEHTTETEPETIASSPDEIENTETRMHENVVNRVIHEHALHEETKDQRNFILKIKDKVTSFVKNLLKKLRIIR